MSVGSTLKESVERFICLSMKTTQSKELKQSRVVAPMRDLKPAQNRKEGQATSGVASKYSKTKDGIVQNLRG